jgi:mannose-6-phosphate isomerase-like protein (cupin superfamily)
MTQIIPDYRDLENDTKNNTDYRRVIFTGKNMQLVLMNLKPFEKIHKEVHQDHDQFIRVEAGNGVAIINDIEYDLSDGFSVIVPAGMTHEIKNTSDTQDLKLYTIYSPPEHESGLTQHNKPQDGGFRSKYLKYKSKYLNLKLNK